MNLQEFVMSLNHDAFINLYNAATYRKFRKDIDSGLNYLVSQDVLVKAARLNPGACIAVLSEKTGLSVELSRMVLDMYFAKFPIKKQIRALVEINSIADSRRTGQFKT